VVSIEPARQRKLASVPARDPKMIRGLRIAALLGAGVTLAATAAHVLELPNKLALDAPLWLAIQQHLYRGWGPFIAPFEVGAAVTAWVLLFLVRARRSSTPVLLAALCLTTALIVFFVFNAPVNSALSSWTPATIPADWPQYRLRWEIGHATSFALVLTAFLLLLRGAVADGTSRRA
jgi:hypothetical protein